MTTRGTLRCVAPFLLVAASSLATGGCGASDESSTYGPNESAFHALAIRSYYSVGFARFGDVSVGLSELAMLSEGADDPSMIVPQGAGDEPDPDPQLEEACLLNSCAGYDQGHDDPKFCNVDCTVDGSRLVGTLEATLYGVSCDLHLGDVAITCDVEPDDIGWSGTFAVQAPGGSSREVTWSQLVPDSSYDCPRSGRIDVEVVTDRGEGKLGFDYPDADCTAP